MRRLNGEDSGFLSLETAHQPMNTMALFVLRAPQPLALDQLRQHLATRLSAVPVLRWRLRRVPFGLGHPVLVDDQGFDLGRHLREHVLPTPGGDQELDQLYAGLAEERLDRRLPLWDLTLVHGLEGGRQAVVLRIHHCLMDGFATLHVFDRLLSDLTDPDSTWQPVRPPRAVRLTAMALRERAGSVRRLPALIARTKRAKTAVEAARSGATLPGAEVPRCSLNQAFTTQRRFARTALPLDDLLLVKRTADVTLNDAALAVVAGALRSYLLARNDLPTLPLVTAVPVGLEPAGAVPRTSGNRLSSLTTALATDVADPWQRLATIGASTREAKRMLALGGPELLGEWLEYVPPALLDRGVRSHERKRHADPESEKLGANVVVSNVRGLAGARRLGPAAVEQMYLSGPPNSGVGTNVVLMDHEGQVFVGIMCFADCVEDPAELARGMSSALAELVEIARTRGTPASDVVPH